ncbi:hypothetical protein [Henriciella litoralis]|uniref:hypothetical protein n=1 Tax=Henriciella litoralis TaxID=568102 RepID=UPI000A023BDC|nr:hypothetical protein [Henriciella litoralis]
MRLATLCLCAGLILSACGQADKPAPKEDASTIEAKKEASAYVPAPADGPTITPDDLKPIVGTDWKGTLTYLDYGDGETESTIPVELMVLQTERTFGLYFTFPEDPEADGGADITISDNGRMINQETVTRRIEEDGSLMVVTLAPCEDNGVQASCEYTYDISPSAFSIRMMVTLEGDDQAFRRHHYSFTR